MNLDSPLACLTHALNRGARSLSRGFEAASAAAGHPMTAPQFTTLARLSGHGALRIGALAEILATDRTTLTRNLAVMQDRGWIAPEGHSDRRLRQWALTEAGQHALDGVMPVWRAWQGSLVTQLGPETSTALLETLKTLDTN